MNLYVLIFCPPPIDECIAWNSEPVAKGAVYANSKDEAWVKFWQYNVGEFKDRYPIHYYIEPTPEFFPTAENIKYFMKFTGSSGYVVQKISITTN